VGAETILIPALVAVSFHKRIRNKTLKSICPSVPPLCPRSAHNSLAESSRAGSTAGPHSFIRPIINIALRSSQSSPTPNCT
jgi:hypothetical protein